MKDRVEYSSNYRSTRSFINLIPDTTNHVTKENGKQHFINSIESVTFLFLQETGRLNLQVHS